MKHGILAISTLGLLHGVCSASEPVAPPPPPNDAPAGVLEVKTDQEKVNYSLGYELGRDLKREDLEFLPEVLIRGIEDAISGARPLVKTTGRQAALAEIKKKRAQEHLEKSQAFLAANAEKEEVQTLPSGLQYKEVRAGKGKTPGLEDKVTVNYRGTLIDGTEFDSSYERGKPATFEVKRVIKGWSEALQLMKEGAQWELYIPPDLAYGKRGREKRIPPNSALIFEVELVSVE